MDFLKYLLDSPVIWIGIIGWTALILITKDYKTPKFRISELVNGQFIIQEKRRLCGSWLLYNGHTYPDYESALRDLKLDIGKQKRKEKNSRIKKIYFLSHLNKKSKN